MTPADERRASERPDGSPVWDSGFARTVGQHESGPSWSTHRQRASMREPSRVRQHPRFRCLSFRLASSSIGEGQERCPWWVPGPDGPRSTLARSDTHIPG